METKTKNKPRLSNHAPPLGAHTSIAGGIYHAVEEGKEIGADVIQIFAKNQVQWQWRDYSEEELEKYFMSVEQLQVKPVAVHSAYLINLATDKSPVREKSFAAFLDELKRTEILRIPYLVLHPGSHLGNGEVKGIEIIANNLRRAIEETGTGIKILLETTAGQGTNLGYKFEHLRDIIDLSKIVEQFGVCFDTCHVFAAGYDIVSAEGWAHTIQRFDEIIGLDKLNLIHLNDSKQPLGSRKDRHQRIGQGQIGLDAFQRLLRDDRFHEIPLILEIPGGPSAYAEDLRLLRNCIKHPDSRI